MQPPDPILLPRPREVDWQEALPLTKMSGTGALRFEEVTTGTQGLVASRLGRHPDLAITFSSGEDLPPQGYRISLAREGIHCAARDEAGVLHAAVTLAQVLRHAAAGGNLPLGRINDSPALPVRGLLVDISRHRVPTLDTLCALADRMLDLKLNHLQLYMEHVFEYEGHEPVWRDQGAMSAAEIRALDHHCRARGIELVPCQQSFGHMENWLRHEAYRHLGITREGSTCLDPTLPESMQFLRSIHAGLLPHFSSRWCNVCCDEVLELKELGRRRGLSREQLMTLYVDHLGGLSEILAEHGKRMMFWGDMLVPFDSPESNRLGQLGRPLPGGCRPLVWGYKPCDPIEAMAREWRRTGHQIMVCPGTSVWTSLLGRHARMRGNLEAAMRAAGEQEAAGMVMTDWTICGYEHDVFSWPAHAMAAARFWNPAIDPEPDLAQSMASLWFSGDIDFANRLLDCTRLAEAFDPNETVPVYFAALLDPGGIQFGELIQHYNAGALDQWEAGLESLLRQSTLPTKDTALDAEQRQLRNGLELTALSATLTRTMRGEPPHPGLAVPADETLETFASLWRDCARERRLAESLAILNKAFNPNSRKEPKHGTTL